MKLMVLDGNSIINRAFYGVKPLTTRDGLYTNAIFGFLNMLQRFVDEEQPEALCVAFDRKEPTFRHEADANYKATRKGMPEELAPADAGDEAGAVRHVHPLLRNGGLRGRRPAGHHLPPLRKAGLGVRHRHRATGTACSSSPTVPA